MKSVLEELNLFAIAQRQLDAAAEFLKLDPAVHIMLRGPMWELRCRSAVGRGNEAQRMDLS